MGISREHLNFSIFTAGPCPTTLIFRVTSTTGTTGVEAMESGREAEEGEEERNPPPPMETVVRRLELLNELAGEGPGKGEDMSSEVKRKKKFTSSRGGPLGPRKKESERMF